MKTLKETYETPQVEVIEVEVEQGFATTGDTGGTLPETDNEPASYGW